MKRGDLVRYNAQWLLSGNARRREIHKLIRTVFEVQEVRQHGSMQAIEALPYGTGPRKPVLLNADILEVVVEA